MNQYPLWRYILIVVLVILGVVYALPNIYGDDPAIQISPSNAQPVTAELVSKTKAALTQHRISYLSIKQQPSNVLVRFPDTSTQLKAQDLLEAALGNKYTIALNLASKTPKWLQALGAEPMKLGLDLRGGIHFLMQVDTDALIKESQNSDVHSMGTQLREANVRYAGMTNLGDKGVLLRFRDDSTQQDALSLLKRNFPQYQFQAKQQGTSYIIHGQMFPQEFVKLQQHAVEQNITILRNRVNELGVAEPVIAQQGKNKISVDLPGIQDTARAKGLIGKVATIRLQLVDTEHDAAQAASTGIVPFGDTLYKFAQNEGDQPQPILLKNQVILHGSSIVSASTITGEDGRPAVSIRAGGSEIPFFNKVTRENVNKPLAVVYSEKKMEKKILDGKVVRIPVQIDKVINVANINQALAGNFQIMGLDSMLYAKNLALLLRSGAYTAPVAIVAENVVGPSLGKANIEMGVLSTEIGSLLVIIFMAVYYRLFGLIANVALILNVVFVVAIMSLLGATMTLPGIAGIVLTVGMAVDANVLINERIREELRAGVTPQAAIYAGYERAFSTIVDANVTTLIVAIVLFALGTGPVQGFAVTLTIGLLTSMVTAIFFTRAIVNLVYGNRSVKQLSIGITVKPKNSTPSTAANQ